MVSPWVWMPKPSALAEYPPSDSSSLTSKMISVPDIARSVRLRLRLADSTAISVRTNLLHDAVRVEPIPGRRGILQRFRFQATRVTVPSRRA